jgi:hypothetical protein
MPDQPTQPPDERDELLASVAQLFLDSLIASLEEEVPPEEQVDAVGRAWFQQGVRVGVIMSLDSLASRLAEAAPHFDPAWTKEQVEDRLEEELYAALAKRQQNTVEWTLRKILREEGRGE